MIIRYKDGNEWAKFDFSVTPTIGCAMEYVNVKYSNQYTTYTYMEGEGSRDACLRVDNDTCHGISHVTFCPRSITNLSSEPSLVPSDITKVVKQNIETPNPSGHPSLVVSLCLRVFNFVICPIHISSLMLTFTYDICL